MLKYWLLSIVLISYILSDFVGAFIGLLVFLLGLSKNWFVLDHGYSGQCNHWYISLQRFLMGSATLSMINVKCIEVLPIKILSFTVEELTAVVYPFACDNDFLYTIIILILSWVISPALMDKMCRHPRAPTCKLVLKGVHIIVEITHSSNWDVIMAIKQSILKELVI